MGVGEEQALDQPEVIRPFAEVLQDHRRGVLHSELGEALNDLVETVQSVGKAGKLVLTLTVKPAAKNSDMVALTDDIKVDLPKPDAEVGLFYVDEDHNLTRDNRRQPNLPLRELPPPVLPGMKSAAADGED